MSGAVVTEKYMWIALNRLTAWADQWDAALDGMLTKEEARSLQKVFAQALADAGERQRLEILSEFPTDALVNGRIFMDRLVNHYDYVGQNISDCSEWQGLDGCFTAFDEYAAAIMPETHEDSADAISLPRGEATS